MRELIIKNLITRRDDGALDRYFNDIEKISLLSLSEEEDLCRRISQGDSMALRRLVLANLRFVISVAKQYQTRHINLSDLISEGNIGLIRAAYRFDHTKGFRFISYAVWWVRQAIIAAIQEHTRLIHIPLNQVSLINQYQRIAAQKEQELQRSPSTGEIAAAIGIDGGRLAELLENTQSNASLDHPVGEGTTSLYELIAYHGNHPDDQLIRDSVTDDICRAMKILDDREREVLQLYFGLCDGNARRLEEISERFSLSVEHTRRLKDSALSKLRKSGFASQLKTCFI